MYLLLLSDSLAQLPKAVCHESSNCDDVVGGSEASDGEIAAVLNRFVATAWRHILRHVEK